MNLKYYTLLLTSLFLLFTLNNSKAQIPQDGLVAYFMLDGIPADSSGMDNHGTIVGNVNPAMNRFGEMDKACSFEGGYIDAGNALDFQITEAITITAWINPSQIDEWSGIVSKWAGGATGGYYLGLNPTSNTLRWNITQTVPGDGDTIMLGEWTHVAATYDGDSVKIYENSVQSFSTAHSALIGDNASSLFIGSQSNIAIRSFMGIMDDVLIYNRGLDQQEIEMVFNSGVSNTQDFLLDRSVELSPNPTNNKFSIKNNSEYPILTYSLFSASGMKLKTAAFQKDLDISEQPSGIYYLILNFADGSVTKKVVKL